MSRWLSTLETVDQAEFTPCVVKLEDLKKEELSMLDESLYKDRGQTRSKGKTYSLQQQRRKRIQGGGNRKRVKEGDISDFLELEMKVLERDGSSEDDLDGQTDDYYYDCYDAGETLGLSDDGESTNRQDLPRNGERKRKRNRKRKRDVLDYKEEEDDGCELEDELGDFVAKVSKKRRRKRVPVQSRAKKKHLVDGGDGVVGRGHGRQEEKNYHEEHKSHCPRCQFKFQDDFMEHMLTHREEFREVSGRLACPEEGCQYGHPDRQVVEAHLKWRHDKVNCVYCGTYVASEEMHSHLRKAHRSLPRLVCYICCMPYWAADGARHKATHGETERARLEEDPDDLGKERCPKQDCSFSSKDRLETVNHLVQEHQVSALCQGCQSAEMSHPTLRAPYYW